MSSQNSLGDTALFARIKNDDTQAFEVLYNRYWPILWRFAINMLEDREMTKDVLQDVFMQLWDKRKGIEIRVSLSGLLYKMTQNKVLSKLSKVKNADALYERMQQRFKPVEAENTTEEALYEKELRTRFEEGLRKMPNRTREIFELHRSGDLSYGEVGELLNITPNTIKTHMKIALRILRSKLTFIVGIFFT